MVKCPGCVLKSNQGRFGTRTCSQARSSVGRSNSSRQVKLPLIGACCAGLSMKAGPGATCGIARPGSRIVGQPSFHVTGSR